VEFPKFLMLANERRFDGREERDRAQSQWPGD
jgi:hypothetical protein